MSPTERAYWLRVTRRAQRLSPELQARIRQAFQTLRNELSDAQLAEFIQRGGVEQLFSGPLDPATMRTAFLPVRERFRAGVVEAAKATARDAPKLLTVAFDVLHPNVIEGIRTLESKVMTTLEDGVRETIRQVVARGLTEGTGPRTIARELREHLSLAPNQSQAVANFERMLRAGDTEALTRALRDKRFDGTLTKAFAGDGLSEEQITRMTAAYRARMEAWNAETIARTSALDAQKLGQRLSWDAAVERGDIDGDRLVKTWVGVMDDRERPSHVAMEGETVAYDAPFSNGQQIPGDDEYNCRCIPRYHLASAA